MADRFPILFSHCIKKDISVRAAVSSQLHESFVTRLSPQAICELETITAIIQSTILDETEDRRLSPFSLGNGKLDTSGVYKLIKSQGCSSNPASDFIWKSSAPPRVKFFVWLLLQGRIQCRHNLCKKTIVDSPICEVCNSEDETSEHIILRCGFAVAFWEAIGFSWSSDQSIGELYQATRPNNILEDQFGTFIALCCWQLWKRRNGIVFRNEALNLQQVLAACKVEAQLWRLRMPVPSRAVTNLWCHVFNNVM
jgi:hypothetical protein